MAGWTRAMHGALRAAALGVALVGCVPAGGGGGGGGGEGGNGGADGGADGGGVDAGPPAARAPARLETEAAPTLPHAAAIGALARLAADPAFDTAAMGDPAQYIADDAPSPTEPAHFASVYYQSGDFAEALEGSRDRRPGVERNDEAGQRVASRIAQSIQLGAVADGPPDARGGARWHALQAARRVDAYALYAGWDALAERSAAGYDRFLGLLWDAGGAPHGTGARIAAADARCGTGHLARIAETLAEARDPFIAALDTLGALDPFDRLVIEEGDSPAYDAAIGAAMEALADGLAVSMLAGLGATVDAAAQAEALGALEVIAADLRAADPATLDMLGMVLDDADPANIDAAAVRAAVATALEVDPCAP